MARLFLLLVMFAFTLGNGAAVAAAICEHPDARAHAAALQSPDLAIASEAMSEERAAGSADKEGMLGDGGAASLLGFIVPPEPGLALRSLESLSPPAAATALLVGRSSPPLLEPPLV